MSNTLLRPSRPPLGDVVSREHMQSKLAQAAMGLQVWLHVTLLDPWEPLYSLTPCFALSIWSFNPVVLRVWSVLKSLASASPGRGDLNILWPAPIPPECQPLGPLYLLNASLWGDVTHGQKTGLLSAGSTWSSIFILSLSMLYLWSLLVRLLWPCLWRSERQREGCRHLGKKSQTFWGLFESSHL